MLGSSWAEVVIKIQLYTFNNRLRYYCQKILNFPQAHAVLRNETSKISYKGHTSLNLKIFDLSNYIGINDLPPLLINIISPTTAFTDILIAWYLPAREGNWLGA